MSCLTALFSIVGLYPDKWLYEERGKPETCACGAKLSGPIKNIRWDRRTNEPTHRRVLLSCERRSGEYSGHDSYLWEERVPK